MKKYVHLKSMSKKENDFVLKFIVNDDYDEELGHLILGFSNSLKFIWIEEIYVEDEFRNMGVGKFILDYVINTAINSGAFKISLFVSFENDIAQKLYKSFGFDYTGDVQYCYKMEKIL